MALELDDLRGAINALNDEIIGSSLVNLDGSRVDVRNNETNLGARRLLHDTSATVWKPTGDQHAFVCDCAAQPRLNKMHLLGPLDCSQATSCARAGCGL